MNHRTIKTTHIVSAMLMATLAACGGNGDGKHSSTSTPTRSLTPTRTTAPPTSTPTTGAISTPTTGATSTPTSTTAPTQSAQVSGLIVVDQSVSTRGPGDVGMPPSEWNSTPGAVSFDRALSHADWTVDGSADNRGATGADGSFQIGDVPAGAHVLEVTKSVGGNLAPVMIPFTVGADGSTTVLAEVGWGLVRATSRYEDAGAAVEVVHGPYGTHVVTRDGRIVELGDAARTLTDADGDGHFDGGECVQQVWDCANDANDRMCDEGRVCSCTASCPDCENCGPSVCVPPNATQPYTCKPEEGCARPGDRCVCVSSCPTCDDCHGSVCVPSCDPVDIAGVSIISGPTNLVAGQTASLTAVARLSDGTQVDVTQLATWESSDESVASVDAWGTMTTHAPGGVDVRAAIGGFTSDPWHVAVVDRPTLRRITVQNLSCGYPLGRPDMKDPTLPPVPAIPSDILPIPNCHQVVQIGATLQFLAFGEFDNGYYQDITAEVQWQLNPSAVGDVALGLFTARQAGTAQLTASLAGVVSDALEIRVVTEPTIVALNIYPGNWAYAVVDGGPVRGGAPDLCLDCRSSVSVLRGDTVRFQATAQYDTGLWEDVTARVTWRSTNTAAASIAADGVMTAVTAGDASIDATLDAVTSNPVDVRVVNEATLQVLSIYQEGGDRVLAKGEQRFFRATGYYDVGITRDVTAEATWRSSLESVGRFETPGVFTGHAAGITQVWAELGGQRSAPDWTVEVYETSDITYCDPNRVNRAMWSDFFNRVVIESDCGTYTSPGVVALRYTVTETQPHGGVFDPCLDLYVYRGSTRVRTLREERCGDPFTPAAAPGRDEEVLKYQLTAFWDLKDESGESVPPGRYSIHGRFYLYYDPVVSLDVIVEGASGRIPCEQNTCGNGCGYLHRCGDAQSPDACPAICTPLCECPPGWGITPQGDCEACVDECCPVGAACPAGVPECELQCCSAGSSCPPGIPPCQVTCCSDGAMCNGPFVPCNDPCCPIDALCIVPLPTCPVK